MKITRTILMLGSLSLLGLVPKTPAAESAGTPPPSAGTPPPDEVVTLSPFHVDVDRDVGYVASSSLAGSRLNTPLRDTPAAISVMTPEFLSDIGAFTLSDAMEYAVNIEVFADDDRTAMNDNAIETGHETYRVRGMSASTARNYFVWEVPTETALVERIEESRGPNSVLFGIASPGGLINANTKQARTGRAFRSASFTVADHDAYRGAIDVNQPLLKDRLAVRMNLVYNENKSFRHFAFEEHKRGHFAAAYRLTDRTRIRAEYERGQLDDNRPVLSSLRDDVVQWNSLGRPTFGTAPSSAVRNANSITLNSTNAAIPRVTYLSNIDTPMAMRGTMASTGTGNVITDRNLTDDSINVNGPSLVRKTRYNVVSAFLEHQFSRTSFLELAFNHQDLNFDMLRVVSAYPLTGDPNEFLPTGEPNPFAGQLFIEGFWGRNHRRLNNDTGRAMFSQELDADKWGNYRFAVLGEYEKAFIGSDGWRQIWVDAETGAPAFNPDPRNSRNFAHRRTYVTEGDWASYAMDGTTLQNVTDPITGRTLSTAWGVNSSPLETYTTKKAMMIAGQARYFDGRLVLAGGYRRDNLDIYNKGWFVDPVTRERTLARDDADATSGLFWQELTGRTSTLGLVYHVTRNLSLFANRSDNLELPPRTQTTQPPEGVGEIIPVPAPEGKTEDFGVGLRLFDDKIYARATYYETQGARQSRTGPTMRNRGISDIMEALLAEGLISTAEFESRTDLASRGLFDHESEGIELEVTANLTKDWRFRVSLAETKATESNIFKEWIALEQATIDFLTDLDSANPNIDVFNLPTTRMGTIQEELHDIRFGTNGLVDYTSADGLGKLGNRRYKASLFTRYDIPFGWLKGAYIGGGYRHQSRMFVGFDDDGNKLYGNSYWYADALAGYTLRLREGRRIRFQLNVKNVFDKRDPLVLRYAPNHVDVFRHSIQSPRSWRLTTTFDF